jgi:hypothetical protein
MRESGRLTAIFRMGSAMFLGRGGTTSGPVVMIPYKTVVDCMGIGDAPERAGVCEAAKI